MSRKVRAALLGLLLVPAGAPAQDPPVPEDLRSPRTTLDTFLAEQLQSAPS